MGNCIVIPYVDVIIYPHHNLNAGVADFIRVQPADFETSRSREIESFGF